MFDFIFGKNYSKYKTYYTLSDKMAKKNMKKIRGDAFVESIDMCWKHKKDCQAKIYSMSFETMLEIAKEKDVYEKFITYLKRRIGRIGMIMMPEEIEMSLEKGIIEERDFYEYDKKTEKLVSKINQPSVDFYMKYLFNKVDGSLFDCYNDSCDLGNGYYFIKIFNEYTGENKNQELSKIRKSIEQAKEKCFETLRRYEIDWMNGGYTWSDGTIDDDDDDDDDNEFEEDIKAAVRNLCRDFRIYTYMHNKLFGDKYYTTPNSDFFDRVFEQWDYIYNDDESY